MKHSFSFGIPEIFSVFGCYALVIQENVLNSVILICLSLFFAMFRMALEIQKKTERQNALKDIVKMVNTDFISSKVMSSKFDGTTH